MNESDRSAAAQQYLDELAQQLRSGQAREHAYRPALQRLMSSFDDVNAINDPARSENGNPDFVFLKDSNRDIILGYAEAKDITVDLDKILKTEQLSRYAGYEKLFLTNYRDFIFLASGEEYLRISIGDLRGETFEPDHAQALRLMGELQAFLEKQPEAIKSGRRLAVIMGGKARRIRDNVIQYLEHEDNERNVELEKIYGLMKVLLVHDLTQKEFADLYAQTLVYGLFAARYNDETPDNFDRREAVEAVPKTNPFLRQFFNHIAGADFDARLRYIVDELCEVFAISDIRALVRHQATKFAVDDEQDLTIHFYEDFLKEYDPVMRQKMGVYYTPVPVVRYIVRSVDKILKEEFSIVRGLASDETITHTVDTQPWRKKGERKDRLTKDIQVPRVQVLDPAVGTATFLNETIKHIYKDFEGQEGRWPAYVKNNLIKRLHGFELMMAPYTIAHLKLSMTLKETGVNDIADRLGVYLTNTLEEGVPTQQDLLSLLGLAGAVSEESQHAADIKANQPIMVVMGNPPYSVSSNNKSKWIQNLIKDYKKDLNERKINLDDDYIKFIRFAENMIAKNDSGIIAMITNNSYIDGVTHRQMRKHLLQTFDKIYILDLHGSTTKEEIAPDGSKDENVFAIKQGVSIVLMVKNNHKNIELGEVYHAELFGTRRLKFNELNSDLPTYSKIEAVSPDYFFVPKDFSNIDEYRQLIGVDDIFLKNNTGIQTKNDKLSIQFNKSDLEKVVDDFRSYSLSDLMNKYQLKKSSGWDPEKAKNDISSSREVSIYQILYRPFDKRWSVVTSNAAGFIGRQRMSVTPSMLHDNVGLITLRINGEGEQFVSLATDTMVEKGSLPRGNYSIFPLYLYHEDGEKTVNFNQERLDELLDLCWKNKDTDDEFRDYLPPEPEDVFDYIYAILHSPSYREKYREFLKTDFPRIPKPESFDKFYKLAEYGKQLRELHLMKAPILNAVRTTTFPVVGNDIVEKISFAPDSEGNKNGTIGRVYINDTQYFGNVSALAWNFYIGGYQPAQKWLKDRKGRPLSDSDLDHYQNIIRVLIETDRIMKQIG